MQPTDPAHDLAFKQLDREKRIANLREILVETDHLMDRIRIEPLLVHHRGNFAQLIRDTRDNLDFFQDTTPEKPTEAQQQWREHFADGSIKDPEHSDAQ